MGRREDPLAPGPLHDFAADLRALRRSAALTYRALAQKAGFSASALSAAARGETLPTLDVTLAYVGACRGDMSEWERRWRELNAQLAVQSRPATTAEPGPDADATAAGGPPDTAVPERSRSLMTGLVGTDPSAVGGIRLAARLGVGAMGRVYLGRVDTDGRRVAVKLIHPDLAADPTFRRRFRRELSALRQVDSPSVPVLIDGDPDAEQPWLATAYTPSVSLADAVATAGPLSAPAACTMIRIVADALTVIHAHGFVHRDLKPSNVLLTGDGARVIDFGIAAAAEGTALTATGIHLGSAAFMAPEQATDRTIGPAADVFALGCLLVYALTGRSPFGEGRADAVLYRVVHEPPDLAALTGVDEDVRALVMACLDKDPDARPAMADVAAALGPAAPPDPGWLPAAVVADVAEQAASADRAIAALPAPDPAPEPAPEPLSAADSFGADSFGATAGPAVPTQRGRTVRRIALVAASVAVLVTGLVVWRGTDNPTPAALGHPHGAGAPVARVGTTTMPTHPPSGTPSTPVGATTTTRATPDTTGQAVHANVVAAGTTGAVAPQNQPAAGPPAFTAIGGPGCPQSGAVTVGSYTSDNGDGWHSTSPSGYTGSGCDGSFLYSAVADTSDPNQWQDDYDWTFRTGLTDPTCTISVFVPASRYTSDSGVYYWLGTGGFTGGATKLAGFTVNQAGQQGQWVTVGSFAIPGGTAGIELTDRGQGSNLTVAAAPLRLTC